MRVWSGCISLDNEGTKVEGIHLWSTSSARKPSISSNARLSFLCIIDIARMPLYIAVGPSLEVQTHNEATAEWFSDVLLTNSVEEGSGSMVTEPWWLCPTRQSEYGVLLKIEDEGRKGEDSGKATDLLLYAATETGVPNPLTPPASSSPAPPDDGTVKSLHSPQESVKLCALPLYSDLIKRAQQVSGLCSPPSEPEGYAYFIPEITAKEDLNAKRQKITSMFEDATKQRRMLKGRGGESVAQAMASIDKPLSQHGIPFKIQEVSQDRMYDAVMPRRKSLSRASTISSLPLDNSRPASRSGALPPSKWSTLRRVESAFSQPEGFTRSDSDNGFNGQNKSALAKVVMAGMRLHGLDLRKMQAKHGPRSSLPMSGSLVAGIENSHQDDEDAYKLIYHQTYKAAQFAFRAHCTKQLISPEAMRDVVDQLLDIFCTDPVSDSFKHDGFTEGSARQPRDCNGAFDVPRSIAPQDATDGGWSTPAIKKRKTFEYFECSEPG